MRDSLPYRLSLSPDLEAFRPEIEYACGFLDRCHYLRRADHADRVLHYGASGPPGALTVPAALFPDGLRVDKRGVHPARGVLNELEAGMRPGRFVPASGQASDGSLGYDALGLIFHQISRIEERDSPERDRYGRFPIGAAMATRQGSLLKPLADRAARDLAAAIRGQRAPANRTAFEVLLTHDVDRLRGYHRPHLPLRYALGDILKRGAPKTAVRRLVVGYLSNLPWSSFREIMDLSERHGRTSRFFFMGPTRLGNDSPYAYTMRGLLRRLVDEVAGRGHVVGFHPGYATATDAEEWNRQRRGLEDVIERPVREGRQHTLRYDAAVTPDIWEDAGMEADYTPAFPEQTAFRSGTCRPYHGYSLVRRRPLRLVQYATAVMDFGLFGGKYRDLTIDEALAEADRAASVCREFGGTLTVLYHTGQPLAPHRPFYRALLEQVLT